MFSCTRGRGGETGNKAKVYVVHLKSQFNVYVQPFGNTRPTYNMVHMARVESATLAASGLVSSYFAEVSKVWGFVDQGMDWKSMAVWCIDFD